MLDHQGIGIDLFPLDGIPDDLESAAKVFSRQNKYWLSITNRLERFREIDQPHSLLDHIKLFSGRVAFSVGYLSRSIKTLSRSPFGIGYDEANKVGTLVGIHSGKFRPFEKAWFDDCQLVFSGHLLSAPSGYHEILSLIYGEYMRLPPEEERLSTHTDNFIWKTNT